MTSILQHHVPFNALGVQTVLWSQVDVLPYRLPDSHTFRTPRSEAAFRCLVSRLAALQLPAVSSVLLLLPFAFRTEALVPTVSTQFAADEVMIDRSTASMVQD